MLRRTSRDNRKKRKELQHVTKQETVPTSGSFAPLVEESAPWQMSASGFPFLLARRFLRAFADDARMAALLGNCGNGERKDRCAEAENIDETYAARQKAHTRVIQVQDDQCDEYA